MSTTKSVSHSQWSNDKERALDRTRKVAKRKKIRAKEESVTRKQVAEVYFKKWLLRKTNYEKAQTLLHDGIESSRAGSAETWKEVGTALAAVDVMLGTFDLSGRDGLETGGLKNKENAFSDTSSNPSTAPKKLKSLREDFFKWSKGRPGDSRHTFKDIVIEPKTAKRFTNQMQETMEEYGQSYNNRNDTNHKFVLSTLSYSPSKGGKPKNDYEEQQEFQSKLLSKMWIKRCLMGWKDCQKEVLRGLDAAMEEALAAAERAADYDGDGLVSTDERAMEESKNNAADNADADYDGDGIVSTDERVRKQVLYSLGLSQLIKMQRADRKEKIREKKEQDREKREEGLRSHTAWSKKKNKGMIKMPPSKINPYTGKIVAAKPPPRMDFSGRGVARPKARTVMQNSVDIMQGSGMKYIHAMGFAKQAGQQGDLEKSRMSLIKTGYVDKRNFVAVNDPNVNDGEINRDELRRAKKENPALRRREELEDVKSIRNNPDKYDAWAAQKSRSSSAVKYLGLVETPYEGEEHKSMSDGAREREWKRVGRLVKGVDLNLLPQWANWSKSYKRFGECQNLWNDMPPTVPTGGTSGFAVIARDTLLRIFSHRRDYDWHSAFDEFTERKIKRWKTAYDARKTDKPPPKNMFETLTMKPAEVRTFFGDHGIELTEAETKSIFFVFDSNDDKKLSRKEFMNFASQAQTSTLNPTSEFWVKLLARDDDQSRDSRVATIAEWDDGERDKCLRELKELASKNLQALERTKVIEEGSAPFPPRLKMERLPSDTPGEQTTTLRLHWTPGSAKDLRGGKDSHKAKNEPAPVVFFLLETGGPMTGRAIKKFVELCKDPPSVGGANDIKVRGGYIHMELQPNTRYQYRLTAFNGFGPSEPVYSSFTTLPMAPPAPRLVSSAVTVNKASCTLEWGEGQEFKCKMKELRRAFMEMDRDGNGNLSREEFLVALTAQPHLREFLTWSTDMTPAELFEGIDGDRDGKLTFSEFSNFFLRRVRTNTQKLRPANAEAGEGRFEGDVEVKTSDSGAAVSTGTKFVLNKCVSDTQPPVFTRVTGAPTHKTRWAVEDLVPGQSYQFTVHAMNLDGEIGPASKATIVSTMMQQPTVPRVIGKPSLDSLQLKWEPAPELDLAAFMLSDTGKNSSLRRSAPTASASSLRANADADMKNPLRASAQISAGSTGDWFKQLNDWASTKSKDGADYAEGGVGSSTVKRVFDRYDVDNSGQLDTHELRSFLRDMGMPYDDDGVDACLIELDSNDDGKVDLDEFVNKFWNKHVVSYIVKRDAGTTDAMLAVTGGRVPTGGKSRFDVCFIGREPQCTVADLAPNTMYRFTVQFRSHRASSPPSTELQIMTPPGPPTQPVAVHTGGREATLKWYPGAGGAAFKYQVYFQRIASRLGSSNSSNSSKSSKKSSSKNMSRDWEKCYEGSDTVCRITDKLEPDSMYNFKVVAMNRQYVCGDASLPTQVCTVRKQDEIACTRDTVDDVFTIDCTGDVVTGDTVLFTERVYAAVKTKTEPTGRRGHGASRSRSKSGLNASGSITLTQSIESLTPKEKGRREFVTERTVAAIVYKELLDGAGASGRSLSLQVLWSTVSRSTPAAKATMLRSGTIITRQEKSLFEFEVLRSAWEHEDSRWTAAEERSTRLLDEGLHSGQNSPKRN